MNNPCVEVGIGMTEAYEEVQSWDTGLLFPNIVGGYRMNLKNLKFEKTGSQILASLSNVIIKLNNEREDLQKKIGEICKNRELDPKEVLEAANDRDKTNAYVTKASNSLGPSTGVPRTIIEALQKDLNDLQIFSNKISSLKFQAENAMRVQNNLDTKGVFTLDYSELVELGF